MKKIFTLLLLNFIAVTAFCQSWDWTKPCSAFGENVNSMAIDNQQSVITAIYSKSGNYPSIYYGILNKRYHNGNLAWQKTFTRNQALYMYNYAGVYGVVADQQGNIYTSNDAYDSVNHVYTGRQGAVCKYDFNGNLLWSRELYWRHPIYTKNYDLASSAITKDEQDNIYVTGVAGINIGATGASQVESIVFGNNTINLSDTGCYLITAKFDKNGQPLWLKKFRYFNAYGSISNKPHITKITSIDVKNGQVVIAGTSNLTTINFDNIAVAGDKGTNFLALMDAANGNIKWAKNIKFNAAQLNCTLGCDAPAARVIHGNNNKLIFTSAFMDTLTFGGVKYSANYKKQYYIAQYDTSGTEEVLKLFPNDNLGNGLPNSTIPYYQPAAITKAGKYYFLHVLKHLYKMDSAYNILWTSVNNVWTLNDNLYSTEGNTDNHSVLTADPSGKIIGQGSNFSNSKTIAGNDTISNPSAWTPFLFGYYSRIYSENNIVSGHVFYDANNNGIKDPGELPVAQTLVGAPANNSFYAMTDTGGLYKCLTDTGNFTFNLIQPPAYYSASPVAGHSISMNSFGQHITNKNFALTPIPGINDLTIDLTGVTANNRPGFFGYCRATVFNKGTTTQSGTWTLRLSPKLQYISATPPPAAVYPDSLVFSYSNLAPGHSGVYDIQYNIKTSAVFGDSLISYARIDLVAIDSVKQDNYDTLRQIVRGSYDPNDKDVSLPGNVSYDKRNEILEYTIRFQNTGNDTAFNIRIIDTLSAKLDINSFELVSSSHRVQPLLTENRVLTFYFDNILLVDSNQNERMSHGMVKFRIKPLAGLQLGDSITNRSSIYFDYNAPVLTNTVKTKYGGYPTVNLGNDITACGGPVNLNASNAGARFVWNTGDTVQTISVTSSGNYWVRVTNQYGFSASDTINVTLKPLPTVNLGADITQCGGNATLNAANPGSSYLWSNGATTQSITTTTSGTYSVKVTNANGCFKSDTVQVTINPLPTVNLGNDITQCGGSVSLNAGNTGSAYIWSNGATTQSITTSISGTYSVKVTNANGCFRSDTISVTIHPLPTVNLGNDTSICAGNNLLLDAGNAGISYLWSTGSTAKTINVAQGGSYSVRVTNGNGCSKADTIRLTQRALPVLQFNLPDTIYTNDAVLQLTANPAGGQFNGTGVSNERFNPATAGMGKHTIRYSYTDTFGCGNSATASIFVNVTTTTVHVFPNPNRGDFYVALAKNLRNTALTIVTPSGQVVGRYTLNGLLQNLRLHLQPGLYYLKFSNTGLAETRRMLVW
jgi:uncharacterized repeat protein (TIGR01451 family)